jgi:molecular chaperone GrpE
VAEPKREEQRFSGVDASGADTSGEERATTEREDRSPTAAGDESSVEAELARLRAEKEDLLQTLVRRQADFENYRKRIERDRHEEGRRGVERLLLDLIPVLDAFDRGIKAHEDPAYEEYRRGITLIRKQLWDALARHGLQRIEAAGKIFDPHVHQAIERAESTDYPDGHILEVFQDGYLFHGRVLRPAIVRVVVHPSSESTVNPPVK